MDSENVGPQTWVVVDEAVRIAYFGRGNEDLKYAVKKKDTWSISILDSLGSTGYYPSMVISPSGKKSIAYYNKTEEKIKIIDPDAMTNQFVASVKTGGENISFCVNSEGKRFISYHDPESGSLMVASESEDGFTVSQVKDGGAGKWSSIEADNAGKLHISFSDPQNKGCLGYAVYDGNSWAIEIVDMGPEAGQFNDICILPDGRPLIVYFDRVYARLLCVISKK